MKSGRSRPRTNTLSSTMEVELSYLFRHAVIRDAAYDLQLPSERGELHEAMLDILGLPDSDISDAVLEELADHAHSAAQCFLESDNHRSRRLYQIESALLQKLMPRIFRRSFNRADHRFFRRLCENPEAEPRFRIEAHVRLAQVLQERREEGVSELLDSAANLAEDVGDKGQLARVKNAQAAYACGKGDRENADKLYGESLRLCGLLGDFEGEATVYANWAIAKGRVGDNELARSYYARALEAARKADDEHSIGRILGNWAPDLDAMGESEAAHRMYLEAIGIADRLGDERGSASWRIGLARMSCKKGDHATALQLLTRAAEITSGFGLPRIHQIALEELIEALDAAGQAEDAIATCVEAVNYARSIGDANGVSDAEDKLEELRAQRQASE